jgi:hypothetical protein
MRRQTTGHHYAAAITDRGKNRGPGSDDVQGLTCHSQLKNGRLLKNFMFLSYPTARPQNAVDEILLVRCPIWRLGFRLQADQWRTRVNGQVVEIVVVSFQFNCRDR